MEIKIGDVVELRSGGPYMTVESVDENGYVSCTWYSKDLEYETFVFRRELLFRIQAHEYFEGTEA